MNPDPVSQMIAAVRDVAFPIGVAWFVLTRLENALRAMTEQLTALRAELAGRSLTRRGDPNL